MRDVLGRDLLNPRALGAQLFWREPEDPQSSQFARHRALALQLERPRTREIALRLGDFFRLCRRGRHAVQLIVDFVQGSARHFIANRSRGLKNRRLVAWGQGRPGAISVTLVLPNVQRQARAKHPSVYGIGYLGRGVVRIVTRRPQCADEDVGLD